MTMTESNIKFRGRRSIQHRLKFFTPVLAGNLRTYYELFVLPIQDRVALIIKKVEEHRHAVIDQAPGAVAQDANGNATASVDCHFTAISSYISAVIEQGVVLEIQYAPSERIVGIRSAHPFAEVAVLCFCFHHGCEDLVAGLV